MTSDARANEAKSPEPVPTSAETRQEYLLWLPAIVALLLYLPTLNHGLVGDDRFLIAENPYLTGISGLRTLWAEDLWAASGMHLDTNYYRPFVMTTYWIQTLLLGPKLWWLRLGNVLLHAGAAALLPRLLFRTNPKLGIPLASLAALLWAVHPLQSERVIWLSGRFDDVIVLLAIVILFVNDHARRVFWVPLTLAIALLSKEAGIALLPAIVAADIVRLEGFRPALKSEGPKWLAASMVVGLYLVLRKALGIYGAGDVFSGVAPSSLLSGLANLSITYARLTFLPLGLDVYHWYTAQSILVGAAIFVAHLVLLALVAVYAWKRRNGALIAGWIMSTLTLLLSSNIGVSQSVYGDRFWSFTGIALTFFLAEILEQRLPIPRLRLLPWLATSAVFALLTVLRGTDWASEESLAERTLIQEPNHPHWLVISAHQALRQGEIDEARQRLERVIELEPNMAKAHNALCVTELRAGRLERAEQECRKATQLTPNNASAWLNLASVFVNAKRYDETKEAAEKALRIQDKNVEAEYLLAIAHANLGAFDDARKHLARGLSYSPRHVGLRKLEAQLAQPSGAAGSE